jgi:hypothetical protein
MPVHSHGTILRIDGNPIANVRRASGPNLEWSEIDDSHLNMAAPWREFSAGLGNAGEAALELLMTPGELAALLAIGKSRTNKSFEIEWPNGSIWECDGFIKTIGNETELDDNIICPVGLKLSGEPDFTG